MLCEERDGGFLEVWQQEMTETGSMAACHLTKRDATMSLHKSCSSGKPSLTTYIIWAKHYSQKRKGCVLQVGDGEA